MNCKFSCDKDKEEFLKILRYNTRLLCGNDLVEMDRVGNKIIEHIGSLTIVPNGSDEYLDSRRLSGETISTSLGNSDIYMKGYKLAPEFKNNQIKHTFSHELWHAIYAFNNRRKDGFSSDGKRLYWVGESKGIKLFGVGGNLVERETGKRYGKLFEETMMDIKASMCLAEFDHEYQIGKPRVNADVILSENISNWSNCDETGYAHLSSITRLMIAAFSNEPNINYHYWIQKGEAIDDMKTIRLDGTIMYANDFLYGMMYDPIFIMEEYDRYMGDGAYLELLKNTDIIYEQELAFDKKIDTKLMKYIIVEITKFANLRMKDLKNKGKFSDSEIKNLSGNFNKIWNSMQKEYCVYFSQDEIRDL